MSIIYRPLDGSHEDIRLIDLLPSFEENSELRCRIRHTSLKDADYKALSYVWGDPTDREGIEVEYEYQDVSLSQNSTEVFSTTVGANLGSALRHLRDKELKLTLWADAICIDQSNNDEKSAQVRLMAMIYKSASEVVVWLGPAAECSDDAMDVLAEVGTEAERFYFDDPVGGIYDKLSELNTWEVDKPVDDRGRSMKSFLGKVSGRGVESRHGIFSPVALVALTNRTWWSRVWVLQEYMLASTVTFACGSRRVPGTQLSSALMTFFGFSQSLVAKDPARNPDFTDYERDVGGNSVSSHSFWMVRSRDVGSREDFSLFDLASTLYDQRNKDTVMQATDSRDKLYALLGMAQNTIDLLPNYNYTCGDVYTEAMMAMLSSGELIALSSCLPQLHNLKLPSWVVDWTSKFATPFNNRTAFVPAGERQSSLNFSMDEGIISTTVLSILGSKVSTISHVGSSWTGCRARIFELSDQLITSIARQRNMVPSEAPLARELSDTILKHQAASTWISELKEILTESSEYQAPYNDTVFNIIICGDISPDNEKKIDGLRRGLGLLEDTGLSDVELWMEDLQSPGDIYHVVQRIPSKAENFRLFVSAAGYVGYAPEETQEQDSLVIFFGAPTPFIIRPLENGRYRFLGPAYVEGIMMGEFMKGDYVEETFNLE
jgi:hypothetical protein